MSEPESSTGPIEERVARQPWYHTIDLQNGVITPGEYDHRSIVARVPLPTSLAGKRCLDVGTHDGFWAFEMERRGGDVVAIDLDDWARLDWPAPVPVIEEGTRAFLERRRRSFALAHEALGSNVDRRNMSVYDLLTENVGEFELAFIGTLLHHLRDPVGALMSIRRVTTGTLVVCGVISISETLAHPRRPRTEMYTVSAPFWELPNLAALKRQVTAGGWTIDAVSAPFLQTWGKGGQKSPLEFKMRKLSTLPRQFVYRRGIPHVAISAHAN